MKKYRSDQRKLRQRILRFALQVWSCFLRDAVDYHKNLITAARILCDNLRRSARSVNLMFRSRTNRWIVISRRRNALRTW